MEIALLCQSRRVKFCGAVMMSDIFRRIGAGM
jgi:hypothetical protein